MRERGPCKISTNLTVKLEPKTFGLICGRSGLALKHGIYVHAGVIDSDYTGELCLITSNHGTKPYTISSGDKIGQLVVLPYIPQNVPIETTETRGARGFGSSGY